MSKNSILFTAFVFMTKGLTLLRTNSTLIELNAKVGAVAAFFIFFFKL